MSSQVPPTEQGELQGTLNSLISITTIIGPLLMTNIFYWFTKKNAPVQFPGAPFVAGAVLCLLSAWMAYRFLHSHKVHNLKHESPG
jgi:DHA1 family tetracycline resistance protein-like MFS transporter